MQPAAAVTASLPLVKSLAHAMMAESVTRPFLVLAVLKTVQNLAAAAVCLSEPQEQEEAPPTAAEPSTFLSPYRAQSAKSETTPAAALVVVQN